MVPGDIIETWGKGSFYGGNPEFVDQEGVYSDKREFKIVGHDDSLAKPVFMSSIGAFWNDNYKNHYLQFLAKKAGADTVTDQNGQTIKLWDATAYASKTIPGNTGDTLMVSGVLTMESYGYRFRCDSVTITSTGFPAASVVSSRVIQTPAGATASPNVWYNWDVTSFVQSKLSGNKLVSLVVKPVTEGSTDATTPSYGFDAKEYGSNAPVLQVQTQASGATIAHVDFYYRYSSDNSTWSSWTLYTSSSASPFTASFPYPQGQGYYEFFSRATDSNSNFEPAPAAAQAATHYTAAPAYYPTVSLDNLYQKYDGSPKAVSVTTLPTGASYSITYNGSSTAPVYPGIYWVAAAAAQGGNTVTTAATLTIGKGTATVNLGNWSFTYDGSSKVATASTIPSGLTVSTTYNCSFTAPINAGTYNLAAMINDSNYQGSATGTMTISDAGAAAVPAMGPWGIVSAAALLGRVSLRRRSRNS
jgi:hypothetical protein